MRPEADSWKKIEEVFEAALAEPPGERGEFLRRVAVDPTLRAEVESLLKAYESDNSLLDGAPPTALEEAHLLQPGDRLGRFEISGMLGRGGMGQVYRARDQRLNREVAIKVLATDVTDSERQRFVQEAQAASALNHPNIVTVYDAGAQQGIFYTAMECVEGRTLDTLIPAHGMHLPEALNLAGQIAGALAEAHAAGIVHRDLKPTNVMVTGSGVVKVLDFGLAKRSEEVSPARKARRTSPKTEPGMILGTVGYMSPEQAEGHAVDARSDIFSFGSLLYEMVSGKRAFRRDTNLATLAAIVRDEPDPLGAAVPAEVRKVIARCLSKNHERRYQNMSEVKLALTGLPDEATWRPGRRVMLGALATVAVAALSYFLWFSRAGDTGQGADPELIPFTSSGGRASGNFSPDGSHVVFSWDGEHHDNVDIYVRKISSSETLQLTHNGGEDVNPAFSPDGRDIGFIRTTRNDNRHFFMLVAAEGGGPERIVAEVPSAARFDWLPDGKWVVLDGIRLLSVATGEIRRLTAPPDDTEEDITPAVSPDGRTVAFARLVKAGIHDIFLVNLGRDLKAKGDPRRLTFLTGDSYGPVWTPDGDRIVFQSGVDWTYSLWRVGASGSAPPEHLPFGQGDSCGSPAISRDGKRLLFARYVQDLDIWRLPLAEGGKAGGPAVRFISSTRDESMPRYSRDGKRIAFNSDRGGTVGVWLSDQEGSSLSQVPLQKGRIGAPSWSPDGRRIVYDWNSDVYVADAGGAAPLRVTTAGRELTNIIGEWSGDGTSIYFSRFQNHRSNLWRIAAHGGEAVQLTRNGGGAPIESPDGKFIYYKKDVFAPSPLCKIPQSGGSEVQVLPSVWRSRVFAIHEKGIYFLPGPDEEGLFPIQFMSFATGRMNTVATPPKPLCCGIDVSPDGRFLLYVQRERSGTDLMLVENFR